MDGDAFISGVGVFKNSMEILCGEGRSEDEKEEGEEGFQGEI